MELVDFASQRSASAVAQERPTLAAPELAVATPATRNDSTHVHERTFAPSYSLSPRRPAWVSRHCRRTSECPLYPRKRTSRKVARSDKGSDPPYQLGLDQQRRVTLIRHHRNRKLAPPCQHRIQRGRGQQI